MKKKLKKIPDFKTEDEEREFWFTHDSTDYIDWSKAKIGIFPNLKLTSQAISLRLPEQLLSKVRAEASKRKVPYQRLIKEYIAQGVAAKGKR